MATKFSFVIPAYNEEHYIGICLDSIIRETKGRSDVEIIVADNNSSDKTKAVVAKYPSVTFVREMRRGANRTRQTGYEASHGELIAFIDADTEMPSGWVSKVEKEFAADPNLACVSGPFIYYDLPPYIRALVRIFYYFAYLSYLIGRIFFRTSTTIQGGNYTVRRTAFEKIGGQDVNITFYGDDTDLAIRLSKVGKVKFTFKIPIRTSGRRLAKEGAWMMGFRYALNNFWMLIFRRPWTMTANEVRFDENITVYKPESRGREIFIAMIFFHRHPDDRHRNNSCAFTCFSQTISFKGECLSVPHPYGTNRRIKPLNIL
jgi:cellulose synthase/poly-beta-1,6-N-acetylglucosamine synthase-like glycosyltransferase